MPAPPDAAAFYLPDGDAVVATVWTRGPWSADHQHGGPPAALLGRALEAALPAGHQLVRVVVDFLRPVPLARLAVRTTPVRTGRKVALARAELVAGDAVVAFADGLSLRRAAVDVPAAARREDPPPPGPDGLDAWTFPFFPFEVAYHRAIEMRVARGEVGRGELAAWLRPRVPVVLGEPMTPWQRVLACADSGHGVSFVLPVADYVFANPDLAVWLHREPVGDWICLDARTIDGEGIGVADTRVYDARGSIGRVVQSQLVEAR